MSKTLHDTVTFHQPASYNKQDINSINFLSPLG